MRFLVRLKHASILAQALLISIVFVLGVLTPSSAQAATDPAKELAEVGITAELGREIDLSLRFIDSTGTERALSDLLIPNRPLVVVPAYYECPRMCGLLLNGVVKLLSALELELGRDFSIATVSFDPSEGPELAGKRAAAYRAKTADPEGAARGWHFLTGDAESIERLMTQLGFNYRNDGEDYSHTSALFFVTPRGLLSQYLAGVEFAPETARLALVEASQGAIGSMLDQVFLFCFRYDHMQGKYTWAAFGIMRAGGVLTLSFLALLIYRMIRKERGSEGLGEQPGGENTNVSFSSRTGI